MGFILSLNSMETRLLIRIQNFFICQFMKFTLIKYFKSSFESVLVMNNNDNFIIVITIFYNRIVCQNWQDCTHYNGLELLLSL